MSTVNDNVRYAESHEWVSVDGDIATIGISDLSLIHISEPTRPY